VVTEGGERTEREREREREDILPDAEISLVLCQAVSAPHVKDSISREEWSTHGPLEYGFQLA
jgi:hypothetical protein